MFITTIIGRQALKSELDLCVHVSIQSKHHLAEANNDEEKEGQ